MRNDCQYDSHPRPSELPVQFQPAPPEKRETASPCAQIASLALVWLLAATGSILFIGRAHRIAGAVSCDLQ